MDPTSLENKLNQGEIHPIYLWSLEEPYWADRLSSALKKSLKAQRGEVEDCIFSGKDFSLDTLLSEIRSVGLFFSHRLFRLIDIPKLKKADWEKIHEVVQESSASSTLVFICDKKDGFREGLKELGDLAISVEGSRPKPRELPGWVIQFAKEEKKTIDSFLAQLFVDLIGPDLQTLRNQMILLATYLGERERVSREDLESLFSETAEKDAFALTRALSEGSPSTAFLLLKRLIKQGEAPLRLLGLLTRHYRLVIKAKILMRKGLNASAISAQIKLPSFILNTYLDQARQLSWKKLIGIYRGLFQADQALKSSPVSQEIILEAWIRQALRLE